MQQLPTLPLDSMSCEHICMKKGFALLLLFGSSESLGTHKTLS